MGHLVSIQSWNIKLYESQLVAGDYLEKYYTTFLGFISVSNVIRTPVKYSVVVAIFIDSSK